MFDARRLHGAARADLARRLHGAAPDRAARDQRAARVRLVVQRMDMLADGVGRAADRAAVHRLRRVPAAAVATAAAESAASAADAALCAGLLRGQLRKLLVREVL